MARKISITEAIKAFIDSVSLSRSANTSRTYRNGMNIFIKMLEMKGLDPNNLPVSQLKEDSVVWLATSLKDYTPTTERLYLTAATQFFEYLTAENLAPINLARVRLLIKQRARRPGKRLPQFPRHAIEEIVEYAQTLNKKIAKNENERLRNLRDRAFLITLSDTGLRVHEACMLRRGDIDWNEHKAIIVGKGNREAVVRFSGRAQIVIRDYLSARSILDGSSGRPLTALPIFARHDKGTGKKIQSISTATGRNIVKHRVEEIFGPEAIGSITPHSFRHYFVTTVLQASGNLKLAQELARHQNIAVTTRYAHLSDDELDKGYWDIFNQK
ncbi:MAG: tyrosine-type recombinase/integrase [Anaerolineaceae bacterium]|nr:tyrosine-type recombinase/integrase [Anaerolineaceae bacterium]